MTDMAPLEATEVERFVHRIYTQLFDAHAPVGEFLSCLDDDELEMRFPEVTLHGHAEFRQWYDRIITTFFDEVHTVKELEVTTGGDRATVRVLVNWQASTWKPPAARSERSGHDAGQSWVVKRSPRTLQPVIIRSVVETYVPMDGCSTAESRYQK